MQIPVVVAGIGAAGNLDAPLPSLGPFIQIGQLGAVDAATAGAPRVGARLADAAQPALGIRTPGPPGAHGRVAAAHHVRGGGGRVGSDPTSPASPTASATAAAAAETVPWTAAGEKNVRTAAVREL